MNTGVSYIKKELLKFLPVYEAIASCVDGGETEIKSKREKFLPNPVEAVPTDIEGLAANKKRYENYLKRAVFHNVSRRALNGSIGLAFVNEPTITVSGQLKYILNNVDGSGISLLQQVKKTLRKTYAFARCGLFVDFPQTNGSLSTEDVVSGRFKPTITLYAPENIINWRTEDIGADTVLSLVVLKETYEYEYNEFEEKEAFQYRVLKLVDGIFVTQIWREVTPTEIKPNTTYNYAFANNNFKMVSESYVTDYNGDYVNEILFTFVGAESNDVDISYPSFYDICSINLAHYRNSADYEEYLSICGQPTPVFTGLSKDWVEDVLGGVAQFGSRGGIPLPVNADAKLLQVEPTSALKEAMTQKEEQMQSLGARLLKEGSVEKSATESNNEAVADSSYLLDVAGNVEAAYNWCLEKASLFTGEQTSNLIKFNMPDFNAKPIEDSQNVETQN